MENTKKRVEISLLLSMFFYFLWLFYDAIVYMDINNKNLGLLTILCIFVGIPLFLFSTFFIKNEYKVMQEKTVNHIVYHFWIHIIAAAITISLSRVSSIVIFIVSFGIKCVAMLVTYNLSAKIYNETINSVNVNENKRLELIFQDATIAGITAFILSSFMFGGVFLGGKNILTLSVAVLFLCFILCCNYLKFRLIKEYKIVRAKRVIIVDNLFIIIAVIVAFLFSDNNILASDVAKREGELNLFQLLFCILLLIPLMKTNKIIGSEWNRVKGQ